MQLCHSNSSACHPRRDGNSVTQTGLAVPIRQGGMGDTGITGIQGIEESGIRTGMCLLRGNGGCGILFVVFGGVQRRGAAEQLNVVGTQELTGTVDGTGILAMG